MKFAGLFSILLGYLAISSASATEIYQWVDENGVVHFSQSPPPATVHGAKQMTLEDTTPSSYDPEEDVYGVEAQAERMAQLRGEMAAKREKGLDRQRNAASQPVVQYQQPVQYGYPYFGRPPYHPGPRPPARPEPPVPELYPTSTLRPPGRIPD